MDIAKERSPRIEEATILNDTRQFETFAVENRISRMVAILGIRHPEGFLFATETVLAICVEHSTAIKHAMAKTWMG